MFSKSANFSRNSTPQKGIYCIFVNFRHSRSGVWCELIVRVCFQFVPRYWISFSIWCQFDFSSFSPLSSVCVSTCFSFLLNATREVRKEETSITAKYVIYLFSWEKKWIENEGKGNRREEMENWSECEGGWWRKSKRFQCWENQSETKVDTLKEKYFKMVLKP
jgi:hypothetical protein